VPVSRRRGSGGGRRIEREFDPAVVGQLTQSSARDLSIGGAELAGRAMAAGLVDERHLLVCRASQVV